MARTKEFNENDILDKAMELFWHKGYNGSSIQEVVDYLGLSRSSIYDTFGDKHQLYLAALSRYQQKKAGALIEIVKNAEKALPAINQILEMAVTESMNDKLFKGCFMVNSTVELASHDKEIDKIVRNNREDIENAFHQLIKKGQDSGEIQKKNDAMAISRFLFNTISGLRVAAKSGAGKEEYDDIVKLALSVVN